MKADDGAYQDADGVWRANNREHWEKINRRAARWESFGAIVGLLLFIALCGAAVIGVGMLLEIGAGLVP